MMGGRSEILIKYSKESLTQDTSYLRIGVFPNRIAVASGLKGVRRREYKNVIGMCLKSIKDQEVWKIEGSI